MRTNVKAIVTAVLMFCFYLSSFSQQVAKTIPNSTSPDGLIGFLEFRPKDYGTQKHPLIIFLHGIGERGNGTSQVNSVANNAIPYYCSKGASMRFTVAGQTSSFVVLSPQLSASYGYWPTFYVKEMINYAKANLQIDPNRIYITGLSLGGGGTWRSITDAWNFDYTFDAGIAAAAPVCGTQEETDADFCKTIGDNHLPVWAFHSMDDGTVGVGATQHAEILAKNCGLNPAAKFTYYQSGGHSGAWINAYDTGHITTTVNVNGAQTSFTANPNLYEWFLSNTRSTVTPPVTNTPPVANAGGAQTITLPTNTVSLSGSGTGTGGASISSFAWVKTSGPASGTIASPSAASTSVTGLAQGTYVFTLTVTDNHGLTNSATVTITVNPAPAAPAIANQLPVSVAGAASTFTLPANSVSLDGSASYDPDGSIVEFYWSQTSGPSTATIANNFAKATTASNLVQGTYVFTLQTKDNAGGMAWSMKSVTVSPAVVTTPAPAPAPAPAPPATGNLLGYIRMDASADLACADVATDSRIAVYGTGIANGNILYKDAAMTQPYNGGWNWFSFTPSLGTATTYAFAIYPVGSIFLLRTCSVAPTGNTAPVANAGATQAITLPTSSITLSGTGTGTNGAAISSYSWSKTSGPAAGNITTPAAASTTVTGLVQGTYSFALTVTDNHGLTASAGVSIIVNPAAAVSNLLGYIRLDGSSDMACADGATAGRLAVYGTGIGNGNILYTDAAMTQPFAGGWNWFSFTPTLGGASTYAFAVYPVGSIFFLRNCGAAGARIASGTTAEQDDAALRRIRDSANAAAVTIGTGKLSMYPNPVHSNATIELNSADDGVKTINLFNTVGVLKAKYTWQTVKGNNVYSLKDAAGLANGLYIIDIRDASGKSLGSLKFLKL